jgi:hypothetical protein
LKILVEKKGKSEGGVRGTLIWGKKHRHIARVYQVPPARPSDMKSMKINGTNENVKIVTVVA